MANVLKMTMIEAIQSRRSAGLSGRETARRLGIGRGTVSWRLRGTGKPISKPAKAPIFPAGTEPALAGFEPPTGLNRPSATRGSSTAPVTGKTHLAQAIGYAAIKQGRTTLDRSIFDVVQNFLRAESLNEDDSMIANYLRPDLLIIDDMGMKQLPKRSGEYLFEIIMRRHQTRSMIMTSNRPLEDWGKLLGDVPSASAILHRFLHHAAIITLQGQSYRLRNRLAVDSGPYR